MGIHALGTLVFIYDLEGVESTYASKHLDPSGVSYVSDEIMGKDEAFYELSELLDSTPLFLPTEYNYTTRLTRLTVDEAKERAFESFGPRFLDRQKDVLVDPDLPEITSRLRRASEPQWVWMPGVATVDQPQRAAVNIRIVSASGKELRHSTIEITGSQQELFAELWRPVVFTGNFDELGPVGSLRMIESSGIATVDQALNALVNEHLRDAHPMASGFVKIMAAPGVM